MLRADGTLKDPAALRALFEAAGIDLARPVISYCQLGLRGTVGLAALERAGASGRLAVYDGSMREWLNDERRFPVEVS